MIRRRNWLPALLWTCFAAGLLVQACAPNLKIENRKFVLSTPTRAGQVFDPQPLIERERQMQLLAALLTGAAALGLAFCYRERFLRPSQSSTV